MTTSFYKTIFLLLIVLAFTACQRDVKTNIIAEGNVNLHFKPVVDAAPLDFNTSYRNAFGEDYTVKTFKFYIQKIELINNDNRVTPVTNDYFLVDAGVPASTILPVKAPNGKYKAIAFTIGVDSARNVSGAQTQALDPAKGMFWTWNSGYIMAKFEGASPASNQPGNRFEFHIGGFKGSENVVKRIELPFPNGTVLDVMKENVAAININANANAWFNSIHPLDIFTTPVCMTPGPLARSFADNYYTMFTVTAIENH
jgi:hypothetical protein